MDTDDGDRAMLAVPVDGDALRALARHAAHLAEQVADAAARARSVREVDWRSAAADGMRADLESCVRQAEACARGLVDAATELARFASSTERRAQVLRAAAEVTGGPGGLALKVASGGLGR